MSNFEGGIRVGSFISGGVVPAARRGTKYEGLVVSQGHCHVYTYTTCKQRGRQPHHSSTEQGC